MQIFRKIRSEKKHMGGKMDMESEMREITHAMVDFFPHTVKLFHPDCPYGCVVTVTARGCVKLHDS